MSGRYIRQKRDGMRDPTMTHVEDPSMFHQGDYVMDNEGMYIISSIDEIRDGLRFIHLIPSITSLHYLQTQMPGVHTVHDLRPYDLENFEAGILR